MRDQTWRRIRQFVFANRRNNGSTCRKPFKKRLRCLAHARDCGEGGLGKGRKRKKSERRSQCNMCSFEATTRLRLRAHRQAEHGGLLRKHRCTRCCAQFASSRSYVRHVRRHASKVAFLAPPLVQGCQWIYKGRGSIAKLLPLVDSRLLSTNEKPPFFPQTHSTGPQTLLICQYLCSRHSNKNN